MDKNLVRSIILLSSLFLISPINAGLFLDVDFGLNRSNYRNEINEELLGKSFPLALVRLGYNTEVYQHSGGLNISGHTYFEHMSSFPDTDSGINMIMIGVRFE